MVYHIVGRTYVMQDSMTMILWMGPYPKVSVVTIPKYGRGWRLIVATPRRTISVPVVPVYKKEEGTCFVTPTTYHDVHFCINSFTL